MVCAVDPDAECSDLQAAGLGEREAVTHVSAAQRTGLKLFVDDDAHSELNVPLTTAQYNKPLRGADYNRGIVGDVFRDALLVIETSKRSWACLVLSFPLVDSLAANGRPV